MNYNLVIDLLENKLLEVNDNTNKHISTITSKDYHGAASLPPMQTELSDQLTSAIEIIKNESSQESESIVLKAITHCYSMDSVMYQKVVGIFKPDQLEDAFKQIREANGNRVEKKFGYAQDVHNYMLEYAGADYYYYSGNYIVGELNL